MRDYVQCSALSMPFADKTFDIVMSCDVLEHIPKEDRTTFIKETARVTKDLVIIAAPFNLAGVREQEISANKYYKDMQGEDHRWLLEHLLDELPNLQEAELTLGKHGLEVDHFSHTALNYWQLVTRVGFLLAHNANKEELVSHLKGINKYYLENIMRNDFSRNGYRTFVVASKKHEIDIKNEPDAYDKNAAILFALLTESISSLL
jgi:cyclopropane fatty-acyl-phospholipid synthase-like methyltransferase